MGREVLAHCQVSQDAVPHPASTRDADNIPQAPLLAWDIVDTNHGRMAYIRTVFERIARFSRLDTPVLPAGEHYISWGLSEGLRLYMTCLGHYYLMLM